MLQCSPYNVCTKQSNVSNWKTYPPWLSSVTDHWKFKIQVAYYKPNACQWYISLPINLQWMIKH